MRRALLPHVHKHPCTLLAPRQSISISFAVLCRAALIEQPTPAHRQRGQGATRKPPPVSIAADLAALGRPALEGRELVRLHRLLLLEEAAMETDICRSGVQLFILCQQMYLSICIKQSVFQGLHCTACIGVCISASGWEI
jgi:hypothetical protein